MHINCSLYLDTVHLSKIAFSHSIVYDLVSTWYHKEIVECGVVEANIGDIVGEKIEQASYAD